ncbi:MAG: hypothetical protein AAGN35_05790 [Bacteroidota bacterium]
MKFTNSILLALSLVFVLASCGRQSDEPAPELPPEASFLMDFADFSDGKMANGRLSDDSTYSNFGFAATNVLIWNVVIAVNAVVPVAAFGESFNHTPQWDRRLQRYVWEYSVTVLGRQYDASLQGWIDGADSRWEMYISQQRGFQNFLWYSGRSAITRGNANWTLNRDPNAPTPYIAIEYNATSFNDARIRYTNIIPGDAGNGGYIEYRIVDDPERDRAYTIYGPQENRMIEIEWSHFDLVGRVKDEIHFGDSDWRCWDAGYIDVDCQ